MVCYLHPENERKVAHQNLEHNMGSQYPSFQLEDKNSNKFFPHPQNSLPYGFLTFSGIEKVCTGNKWVKDYQQMETAVRENVKWGESCLPATLKHFLSWHICTHLTIKFSFSSRMSISLILFVLSNFNQIIEKVSTQLFLRLSKPLLFFY